MKVGETVVKILDIGGIKSAVIGNVTAKKGNVVTFGKDKHLRYNARTGQELDPAPGFASAGISSYLIRLDGAE